MQISGLLPRTDALRFVSKNKEIREYIDLTTGFATQCYCGVSLGDVFADPNKPFPEKPVGICSIAHCYNGHAFLTLGLMLSLETVHYGDIRNKVRSDGTNWLQNKTLEFFNSKLIESNDEISDKEKRKILAEAKAAYFCKIPVRAIRKIKKYIKGNET